MRIDTAYCTELKSREYVQAWLWRTCIYFSVLLQAFTGCL